MPAFPPFWETSGRSRARIVPTFSAFTKRKSAITGTTTNGVRMESPRRSKTCSMSPPPSSRSGITRSEAEKPSASGIWKRSRMLCPQSMTSCMRRASTASPCFLSLPPGNSSDSSALTILTTPFMTSLPKYCRSSAAIGAASARISMPRKRCAKAAPGSNLSSSPSGARPIWSMSSPRTTAASSAAISRRIPSRRSRESPAVRRILPASSASGSQSL